MGTVSVRVQLQKTEATGADVHNKELMYQWVLRMA